MFRKKKFCTFHRTVATFEIEKRFCPNGYQSCATSHILVCDEPALLIVIFAFSVSFRDRFQGHILLLLSALLSGLQPFCRRYVILALASVVSSTSEQRKKD